MRRYLLFFTFSGAIGGLLLALYAWAFACFLSSGFCTAFWSDTKLFAPLLWAPACAVLSPLAALARAKLSRLPLETFVRECRPLALGTQVALLTVVLYAIFHAVVFIGAEPGGIVLVLIVAALYGAVPILALGLTAGWAFKRLAP